jgi:hypothetical protein
LFYVLDQNVMRSAALAERVRTECDAAFVVPDTAFVEMVKSDRWEHTMRGSLAALVSVPDKTFVSLSTSEVMRVERAALQSINRAALFPAEFTALIRELIPALTADCASSAMDSIRTHINGFRADLLIKEVDPIREKEGIERLVALLEAACGPAMTKDLRSGRMGPKAQLGLIQLKAPEIFAQAINLDGGQADPFRRSKPLLLRHIYLQLRHAMQWVKSGGLKNAKPNKVLNHRLDQEYVLIASYCDAFLTDDRNALEADEDLRMLIDDARQEELEQAIADYLGKRSPALV